jgi:hypothetical protein
MLDRIAFAPQLSFEAEDRATHIRPAAAEGSRPAQSRT